MQPVNRMCQGGLLVVHRDHHVEHRHAERAGRQRGVRPSFEDWWSRAMSVMTSIVEPPLVFLGGHKLCASYEFRGAPVRS